MIIEASENYLRRQLNRDKKPPQIDRFFKRSQKGDSFDDSVGDGLTSNEEPRSINDKEENYKLKEWAQEYIRSKKNKNSGDGKVQYFMKKNTNIKDKNRV